MGNDNEDEVERPDFSSGALAGVRVVELSRVIAGPYIGRLLADMGADVVKIEPPEGDQARQIAPKHDREMSAHYTFANVGKRSMTVDLRAAGAAEFLLDLVRLADVVTENFRPGVMELVGLGWQAIHAANQKTILVSINGYGADSRWCDRRAYAPIMHAVTGILHDQSQYDGSPVAQLNNAHGDIVAALHATVSVLAALRVVEATGQGQCIEIPMFDAVLSSHTQVGAELLPIPDDRVMNPIYHAGALGDIALAGPVQHVWGLLARANLDLKDPTPPGADLPTKARLRHATLESWMASQPSQSVLIQKLEAAGLACGAVDTLGAALRGPLAQERGLLVEVDDRRGGKRSVVRPPARFSASRNEVRGCAPLRGERLDAHRGGIGVGASKLEPEVHVHPS